MKLHIINSGSAGNCYILEGEREALIIELGVPFKDVKKALDFDLTKIVAAIITHEHMDHCKGIKEAMAAGVNVYASNGTMEALNMPSHRMRSLTAKTKYVFSEFTVLPFDVKHDAKEPLGFIIHHQDCGNVLFITDSYYVPYKFPGLNNIIVEANYCENVIKERSQARALIKFVKDRVIQSHMSLTTCKQLLAANDLRAVNNIVLIHLSDSNSDAIKFQKEVSVQTGKSVHIATKGMVLAFKKTPF